MGHGTWDMGRFSRSCVFFLIKLTIFQTVRTVRSFVRSKTLALQTMALCAINYGSFLLKVHQTLIAGTSNAGRKGQIYIQNGRKVKFWFNPAPLARSHPWPLHKGGGLRRKRMNHPLSCLFSVKSVIRVRFSPERNFYNYHNYSRNNNLTIIISFVLSFPDILLWELNELFYNNSQRGNKMFLCWE